MRMIFLLTFFLNITSIYAEDFCSEEFYNKMMRNNSYAVKLQMQAEELRDAFIEKIKTTPTPDDLCATGKEAVKKFQHSQSSHAIVWRGFSETADNCYGDLASEASERSENAKIILDYIRDTEIVTLKNYLSRICN